MATKRKRGKWQDYTRVYRVARSKGKVTPTAIASGLPVQSQMLVEPSEWTEVRWVAVVTAHRFSRSSLYIGDVQSELAEEDPANFDILAVPHHGARPRISARVLLKNALTEIQQRFPAPSGAYSPAIWEPSEIARAIRYFGGGAASRIAICSHESADHSLAKIVNAVWQESGRSIARRTWERWGSLFELTQPSILEEADDPDVGGWIHSSDAILARLRDASLNFEERRLTVLFAETVDFDDAQLPELLTSLNGYILAERFTQDENAQTVVGAAIRKYAMNMNEDRFEHYAQMLKPSRTEVLSHYVELELVKGICWRLYYEPINEKRSFPELTRALSEIVRDYVTPRLIVQKNYASTALHAIVAVVCLQALAGQSDAAARILTQVAGLDVQWFAELLEDRLEEYTDAAEEHDAALAESVREFVTATRK